MRQDLTSLPTYQTLTEAGFPAQVALRATWLLGGREDLFLDYRATPAEEGRDGDAVYEVVAITAGRVVHVLATESAPAQQGTDGRRFQFHKAVVWSRDNLSAVTAGGDEDAWEALLSRMPEANGLRSYTLVFDGPDNTVTIPLSAGKQDEADILASSLVYKVG